MPESFFVDGDVGQSSTLPKKHAIPQARLANSTASRVSAIVGAFHGGALRKVKHAAQKTSLKRFSNQLLFQ